MVGKIFDVFFFEPYETFSSAAFAAAGAFKAKSFNVPGLGIKLKGLGVNGGPRFIPLVGC